MTPGFGRAVLLDRRVQALAAGALVVVSVIATGDLAAGWNIIDDGSQRLRPGSLWPTCSHFPEHASARTPLAVRRARGFRRVQTERGGGNGA
jgi:hypothetical protein